MKTQEEVFHDKLMVLLEIAIRIDRKVAAQEDRTKKMCVMARLAREGKKESDTFRQLASETRTPIVTDISSEIKRLREIVKTLK